MKHFDNLLKICCRLVTQLLTDVIYFVAYQESSTLEPLEVVMNHNDRERSKLLREQNILKQVLEWLRFNNNYLLYHYLFISICICIAYVYYKYISLCCVVALQNAESPFHRFWPRISAADGGFGRPKTCFFQVHLPTLLPDSQTLTT